MAERIVCAGLQVDKALHDLLVNDIAPGTGVTPQAFWEGLAAILSDMMPRNAELLQIREAMQAQLDTWHREHSGTSFDPVTYKAFLEEIGYLLPQPAPFRITTENVDAEIAHTAGPQLVVPVMNARF